MADAKILSSVKQALGNTGTYQDGALNVYIDEIISYMVGAGVPESVANSTASAGVIALGVTDLQYRGGKPSAYFYERVSQLNYEVDTEAEALKKEVAALQEQIATEQKEIETLQRELETAQSASNNLRAEVTELERQIAAKQAEIEALTQEKAILERLVDELRAENETLKAQAETVEQQHNAEKAEMQKQHTEEVAALEQAHAAEVEALEKENATIAETSYNDGANAARDLFGIPNEVTGTNVVTLDYVNENEHNVEVKLSSDTVTDFSGVTVKTYKKNLFYKANENRATCDIALQAGTTITVSAESTYAGSVEVTYTDDTKYAIGLPNTENGRNYATYTVTKDVKQIMYRLTAVEPQVEISPFPTEYEPCTEKTYTANADGTVDGVTSISPTTNIICEGVDITAKYYQNPNKFTRNDEILFTNHGSMYKKNHVVPISIGDGFYQYAYRYADKMETLDAPLTRAVYTGSNYVFQGCTNLKSAYLPMITKIGNFFFGGCVKLTDIVLGCEEYPMNEIGINALSTCESLKNLTYIGVISGNLNLQWSTLLTHESLMYLINALEDKSADTSGATWTLTIGSENLAKLDETTELAIAWRKGWDVI